ncbi:unnamed protein product [Cyclocybe aegerita]|uniref:Uncharacterized protein n=1 Tax=Cyclocybe aegerita TaxID=1973307 RepID=A0A8S0WMU5_CYCAE|nr:unnamed protein product [Cyclocybe aegerita]
MSLGPICELSQELINAIVDIIYEDVSREPWTVTLAMHHLYSYPLICSAFLHRSQSHIFAEIRLGKKDGDKQNRSHRNKVLAKLLARNPHLADHIHSLHLTLPKKDNAWIHKDQHFLRVLPLITDNGRRLKKLTIYGYVDGYIKNPDKAAARFFRPYISSSISSLHLSWMSKFPLDILKSLIRLKHLKLEGVKALETTAPFSPPFLRFEGAWKLQTVECSYGADCLRNLVAIGKPSSQDPQIDLSALQSMKIYIDKANDIPAARELMQVAGCSLKEVHLVRSHFAGEDAHLNPTPREG